MPEDGLWNAAEVVATEPPAAKPEFRQPVIVRAGETEVALVLIPGDEAEYGKARSRSGDRFSVRRRDEVGSCLDWRVTVGEGPANEQRLAALIMLAAVEGKSVDVIDAGDGHVLVSGALQNVTEAEEWRPGWESARHSSGM